MKELIKKYFTDMGKKKLITSAVIILFVIAIIGTPKLVSVMSNSSSEKKLPIYCVQTDKPQVALSFDAAWGNVILC